MEGDIIPSAPKEQGGETGDKELVTEPIHLHPGTVPGQLPVPFKAIVGSPVHVEVGEEWTQSDKREGIPVESQVAIEPELTIPPFTETSAPPDEIRSGRSVLFRLSSSSSTDSLEESLDLTPERFRSLKKKLKESRRELRKRVLSQLDLANCKL